MEHTSRGHHLGWLCSHGALSPCLDGCYRASTERGGYSKDCIGKDIFPKAPRAWLLWILRDYAESTASQPYRRNQYTGYWSSRS